MKKKKEKDSAEKTLNLLPGKLAGEFIGLWREFEEGITSDAKFAKSIDRLPPLLHNINDNGHSWKNMRFLRKKCFQ